MQHAPARLTPRRDTRGALRAQKKPCCRSCAAGGPCEDCAAKPADDHGGACCGSCAAGGGCEGDRLPPAVYAGHVPHERGAELWVVREVPEAERFGYLVPGPNRVRLVGSLDAVAPGEEVVASVVAADLPRARVLLAKRAKGDLGRKPQVGRDTRGLLSRPASYQAFFWGPSDAEEKAFQELYKRYNRLLEHTGIVAQMQNSSPQLKQMLGAWFSFAKLWLAGDEDPDQLMPRAQDLAILENTARDLYGYDKPAGDVVVPMPYDNPVLETIDDLGEVLEDAGVPMADPHGKDTLANVLATAKTVGVLVVAGAGIYALAPVVAAVARGRRRTAA